MAQVLRQNTLTDQNARPIAGANIYVYDNTGVPAVLTSDGTTPLTQPVITDTFGNYKYYANTGVYTEDLFLGTRRIWEQVIAIGTGADVSTLAALAAPGGSALVGFQQSGSGAVSRTAQAKLRDVVSVLDYTGADPTGVADSTAAVQAAHDALGVNGGAIFFPPGSYLVSAVNISKSCLIWGAGQNSSRIIAKDATSDVLNITATNVTVRDLNFQNSVTRTAGSYVLCNTGSSQVTVDNCYMLGWFYGIRVVASGGPFNFRNILMRNGVVGSGQGIRIENGLATALDNVNIDNAAGSKPDSAVAITASGDVTLIDCQLLHCNYGLSVIPGASQVVTSIYAVNTFFDNSGTNGARLVPQSTTATIQRVRFMGCWFSSAGSSGLVLDTSGQVGSSVDGVSIIDCEVFLNGSHGIQLAGNGTKNIKILGGKIAQNTGNGVLVTAPISDWQIIGATIGPVGGLTGNTAYGISMPAGTSNNVLIADNSLVGNTSGPLNIVSTGTDRRIINNVGYNSRTGTTSAITVTASPFTYTAGDQPETIYINGGTVSLVSVDGASVFQGTNVSVRLSPGKSAAVTYSVAPGMAKTLD